MGPACDRRTGDVTVGLVVWVDVEMGWWGLGFGDWVRWGFGGRGGGMSCFGEDWVHVQGKDRQGGGVVSY